MALYDIYKRNDSFWSLLKFDKFVKIRFTSISPYEYAIN